MRPPIAPITFPELQAARARIAGTAVRTPLIRLRVDAPCEIYLKLETLQPIGSFKLRGALNAMRALSPAQLADGVYTPSAGNMAQGVAWAARELGVPCRVIAPDHAREIGLGGWGGPRGRGAGGPAFPPPPPPRVRRSRRSSGLARPCG